MVRELLVVVALPVVLYYDNREDEQDLSRLIFVISTNQKLALEYTRPVNAYVISPYDF